ncbi:piggyBac transposable element-derived protein 4 [Trichonephila clavipes]|nr:piggyBac transposable element-derived protein 4 [Trichonephila clavipes]
MIAYQRGKVCVMKWMDKKAVCRISTIHNPEMVQVQSHKNEIRRKPKAVMEYNSTMGGVDRLYQHLTNYPLIKKRGKKYYKKYSFIYWTYVCGIVLCCTKKNGGKDSHLQFRMDIVDCLIERYGEVSGKKGYISCTSTQSNEID